MTFYDVSPERGRVVPLLSDTSRENPYLFTAWRVEEYEQVMTGDINGYYPIDGNVYTLILDKKEGVERVKTYVTEGHLHISCVRDPMDNYKDKVNWKVTITPVAGGIVATDDLYMNSAPESGYQPSLIIEMKKDSMDYKPILMNQRYFFTANSGQVYGSLFVHYMPHVKKDSCQVDIGEYKVNINGSRNLAVKSR